MRFDAQDTQRKSGLSSRDRLRLWLLVGCLAMVLFAMRQLQRPETAERIGQVFGANSTSKPNSAIDGPTSFVSTTSEATLPKQPSEGTQDTATPPASETNSPEIKDNTYLRPQERDVWFDTFEQLAGMTAEQLRADSLGNIAYAQFIQQPDEYRHQVVTLRGWVVREELKHPGKNRLGVESYHRLWLQPEGGGQWPFVVFCRTLPEQFPRGDGLRAQVEVDGLFFKNWSYSFDGGLGLAPVVLANEVVWSKPKAEVPLEQLPVTGLVWASTAAGVFALIVVWGVLRNTSRARGDAQRLPATFLEPEMLADQDNSSGGRS